MRYNELTLHHFRDPTWARPPIGPRIASAEAGDPLGGTWVRWSLALSDSHVLDVGFAALACPHVIAVMDWLSARAMGLALPLDELPERIATLRELFALPVEKLGRLLVVEDAWRNVVHAANLLGKSR
jgi:hypothetical protein